MFWYLVVFAILVALALVEKHRNWPGLFAATMLALMCGLRYETGFDWAEYEAHYLFTPGFGETNIYANIRTFSVEPAFDILNRVLNTFHADFQWLLFVVGSFNIVVLYLFARKFSPQVVVVLIWYYGFEFLTGQMATIRQSLSVSFIYLAVMSNNDRKTWLAIPYCVLAALFHSFSIIFIPLVFVTPKPLGEKQLTILALVGISASLMGNDLFIEISQFIIRTADPGIVTDKLQIYSQQIGSTISPVSLALILWHIFFVWIVRRKSVDGDLDYVARVSIWSTWMSVIFHSFFVDFPILWNRCMLVTFTLQAIQMCRTFHVELDRRWFRIQFTLVASLGSLLALIYALAGEQALVYKPYQNVAVTWIRGPYGNGRLRYQIVRNENNVIAAQQKR